MQLTCQIFLEFFLEVLRALATYRKYPIEVLYASGKIVTLLKNQAQTQVRIF